MKRIKQIQRDRLEGNEGGEGRRREDGKGDRNE